MVLTAGSCVFFCLGLLLLLRVMVLTAEIMAICDGARVVVKFWLEVFCFAEVGGWGVGEWTIKRLGV